MQILFSLDPKPAPKDPKGAPYIDVCARVTAYNAAILRILRSIDFVDLFFEQSFGADPPAPLVETPVRAGAHGSA